jgi:Flp pilus assembly protein CpaB
VVRTVVQDVLVLAAGTSTSPPQQGAADPAAPAEAGQPTNVPPKRPDIPFTLAVTPEQSQLILTADIAGDLRLALRPMGDHGIMPLPAANSWSLVGPIPKENAGGGGQSAPAAAAPPAVKAQPAPQAPPGPQGPQQWGAKPTAPAPPGPKRPSVEVIRGTQREIVTFD